MITKQDSNNIQDIFKPLFEALITNFGKVSDELKMQREQLDKLIASHEELEHEIRFLRIYLGLKKGDPFKVKTPNEDLKKLIKYHSIKE